MRDLLLAIAHHVLIFGLFGMLAAERGAVRPGMDEAALRRVAGMDLGYGVTAMLVLIVGFSRVVFAARGWDYYAHNLFFWAKIATFALIGLISIRPTRAFLRWRRTNTLPGETEIAAVRRLIRLELILFAPLAAFAAAMARGYGMMP